MIVNPTGCARKSEKDKGWLKQQIFSHSRLNTGKGAQAQHSDGEESAASFSTARPLLPGWSL